MAKVSENSEQAAAKVKDSTSVLPMVELSAAIDAVTKIRDMAVENAPMKDVAKALEYEAATSTPFYRRVVAARLFGLMTEKSASLTQAAIDYIKPHDEEMKSRVLREAVCGVTAYEKLLENYAGKKLNTALVANAIAKDYNLTDVGSMACAKAFEGSVRFAGLLSPDGCISLSRPPATPTLLADTAKNKEKDLQAQSQADNSYEKRDTQGHKLYLNRDMTRVFSVVAPLDITKSEYDRICNWLKFTLLMDEKSEGAVTT